MFSPDGKLVASAAWDNSVRLWEGRTGKFVATLRGHVGAVYRLAWSADSRLLISASKDSTLKVRFRAMSRRCDYRIIYLPQIWDLKTYKIKNDLPGHTDEVYCVDFVADKVVSGGRDRTVKMYVKTAFIHTRTNWPLDGKIRCSVYFICFIGLEYYPAMGRSKPFSPSCHGQTCRWRM